MSRLIGWGAGNIAFPRHSIVLEENESFQSTWWPVVLVGVKNLTAWNQIATAKTVDAMDACEETGNCTQEAETDAFVFFQVLGPGMARRDPTRHEGASRAGRGPLARSGKNWTDQRIAGSVGSGVKHRCHPGPSRFARYIRCRRSSAASRRHTRHPGTN